MCSCAVKHVVKQLRGSEEKDKFGKSICVSRLLLLLFSKLDN